MVTNVRRRYESRRRREEPADLTTAPRELRREAESGNVNIAANRRRNPQPRPQPEAFNPAENLGVEIDNPLTEIRARNQRVAGEAPRSNVASRPNTFDPSAGVTPRERDFSPELPARFRSDPRFFRSRAGPEAQDFVFGSDAGGGRLRGRVQPPGEGQSLDIGEGRFSSRINGPPRPASPGRPGDGSATAANAAPSGPSTGIYREPGGGFTNTPSANAEAIENLDIGAPGRGGFAVVPAGAGGRAGARSGARADATDLDAAPVTPRSRGVFNPVTREFESSLDRSLDRRDFDLNFADSRARARGDFDSADRIAEERGRLAEIRGGVQTQRLAGQAGTRQQRIASRGAIEQERIRGSSPDDLGRAAVNRSRAGLINTQRESLERVQGLQQQILEETDPERRQQLVSQLQAVSGGAERQPLESVSQTRGFAGTGEPIQGDILYDPNTGRFIEPPMSATARMDLIEQQRLRLRENTDMSDQEIEDYLSRFMSDGQR